MKSRSLQDSVASRSISQGQGSYNWRLSSLSQSASSRNYNEDKLITRTSEAEILLGVFDGRGSSEETREMCVSRGRLTPGQMAADVCATLFLEKSDGVSLKHHIPHVLSGFRRELKQVGCPCPKSNSTIGTSCCVVRVGLEQGLVEILQIGDSAALLEKEGEGILWTRSPSHENFDSRVNYVTQQDKDPTLRGLEYYLSWCNRPDGHGVSCFNGSLECVEYFESFETSLANLNTILIYTDGLIENLDMFYAAEDVLSRAQFFIGQSRTSSRNDDTSVVLLERLPI